MKVKLRQETKDIILPRLRRIEGQIQGIINMVERDRYSLNVYNQLTAVKRALEKVALIVVNDYIRSHLSHSLKLDKDTDELIENLCKTIFRIIR